MKYKFECVEHGIRFKNAAGLGAHKRYKHGAGFRKGTGVMADELLEDARKSSLASLVKPNGQDAKVIESNLKLIEVLPWGHGFLVVTHDTIKQFECVGQFKKVK